MVSLCLTYGDGKPRSQQLAFEYREMSSEGVAVTAYVRGLGLCYLWVVYYLLCITRRLCITCG